MTNLAERMCSGLSLPRHAVSKLCKLGPASNAKGYIECSAEISGMLDWDDGAWGRYRGHMGLHTHTHTSQPQISLLCCSGKLHSWTLYTCAATHTV